MASKNQHCGRLYHNVGEDVPVGYVRLSSKLHDSTSIETQKRCLQRVYQSTEREHHATSLH
jgi:hypothetical protein